MKLSIITINRNNAAGLRKTIESVVSQTYTEFEYIIIDGASTDESVDVIKEYADKITFWVSEPDNGIYNAMNKGILKAKGEYLLFLNSGDWLVDESVVSSILDVDSNEDIVYGDLARTFSDGTHDEVKMPDNITSLFLYNYSLAHPSSFIKKELFLKYGFYDEKYKITADHAFFVKVILKFNVSTLHKNIVVSNFNMDGTCNKIGNYLQILDERRDAYIEFLSPKHIELLNKYNALKISNEKSTSLKGFVLLRKINTSLKLFLNLFDEIIRSYTLYKILNPFKVDYLKIPIIINNRNRLTYLRRLIKSLEKRGYENIIIIDNDSDYPPLLEFYKNTSYKVYRLNYNGGYCSIWDCEIYERDFKNQFYVYTDSDVELVDDCPDNFLEFMLYKLWKNRDIDKVGLSIIIDDLPDSYNRKNEVIKHELQFWNKLFDKDMYDAPIDTTFALYRKNKLGPAGYIKSVRMKPPFSIKHLPWYEDTANQTKENLYYIENSKTRTHWTDIVKTNK